MSRTNASTTSGSGGKPSKSYDSRLMSVKRSASGEGAMPRASSCARTNRSIAPRAHAGFLTSGGDAGTIGWKDQWLDFVAVPSGQAAPRSIHVAIARIASGESNLVFAAGGGIRSWSSVDVMRRTISLALL